ncbi:MAG: platelet-activating factor acetylhydrolase IB subunit [Planctomycetaceae bacterium]
MYTVPIVRADPPAVAQPPVPKDRETTAPVPRDANWMQRHELINSRAVPGAVDLIFIGDSITQGWEDAGKQAWEKFYGSRKAMNAGIGGDRTQHVLWRLDNGNVKGITPKVAVVMIGTNNAKANEPAETAAGIEAVVRSLRQKLPGTKVLLLGVFPRGATPDDPLRQRNAAVNGIVAKLDDGKDVFYLDIGATFLAADGTLSKEIMPDLLHLSPRGYEIWAEAIEPKLKELLGGG